MLQELAPPRRFVFVINPRSQASAKDPEPGTFGARFRELRLAAGYKSQQALSDATGIPQNQISNYELNISRPVQPERLAALDRAFGLEPGAVKGMLPSRASRRRSRRIEEMDITDFAPLLDAVSDWTQSEIDALTEMARLQREEETRQRQRDEEDVG